MGNPLTAMQDMKKIQEVLGKVDFKQLDKFIANLPLMMEAVSRIDRVFYTVSKEDSDLATAIKAVYVIDEKPATQ